MRFSFHLLAVPQLQWLLTWIPSFYVPFRQQKLFWALSLNYQSFIAPPLGIYPHIFFQVVSSLHCSRYTILAHLLTISASLYITDTVKILDVQLLTISLPHPFSTPICRVRNLANVHSLDEMAGQLLEEKGTGGERGRGWQQASNVTTVPWYLQDCLARTLPTANGAPGGKTTMPALLGPKPHRHRQFQ